MKVEALSDLGIQGILDGKLDNISSLMRMVAPDCKRMVLICRSFNIHFVFCVYKYLRFNFFWCRWHGEYRNCSEMFTSSKTDDGFCCSFNTVSLAEGFAKLDDDDGDDDEDYYEYYDGEDYYDYYSDLDIAQVSQPSFDTW